MPISKCLFGVDTLAGASPLRDRWQPSLRARESVALVVDDDALVLRALSRVLHQGFDVLRASNVADAKRWVRAARAIDVAFVDHDLPDGGGSAVLVELLRRHPGAARVLMSGHDRCVLDPSGLEAAHLFLRKPLDLSVVRRVRAATGATRHLLK